MGKVSEKSYLVGDRADLIGIHNCGFCEFSIHMDISKRKEEEKIFVRKRYVYEKGRKQKGNPLFL